MCYLTCKRSRAVDRSRERGDSQLWLLQATHSPYPPSSGCLELEFLLVVMNDALRSDRVGAGRYRQEGFPCKSYALPAGCGFRRRPGLPSELVTNGHGPRLLYELRPFVPGWPLLMHSRDHRRGAEGGGRSGLGQDKRSGWNPGPVANAASRHVSTGQWALAPRTAGGVRQDPQLWLSCPVPAIRTGDGRCG